MLEGMLNDICGPDIFNSIFDTITINLFHPDGKYKTVLHVVETIHESAIKPIALMLMFIFFMLAVVDKLSSENFTWEQLWRQMAMLLAAKFLIDHGFEILQYLFQIGMLLIEEIQDVAGSKELKNTFDAAKIISNFKESLHLTGILSVLGNIVMFIYLLIPWLLSWIMRLCVSVICYSRIIEIYARATFAPIALSDFYHTGLQGPGWRFLKNFLAICLQGAMILVISVIYSRLFSSISAEDTNLFTFIGTYLAFFASAIMLMFKSLSLTKEILGTSG